MKAWIGGMLWALHRTCGKPDRYGAILFPVFRVNLSFRWSPNEPQSDLHKIMTAKIALKSVPKADGNNRVGA